VTYDKLHDNIEEGFIEWYKRFPPDDRAAGTEDEEGVAEDEVNGEHQVEAGDKVRPVRAQF
jgi:hypothetical protein